MGGRRAVQVRHRAWPTFSPSASTLCLYAICPYCNFVKAALNCTNTKFTIQEVNWGANDLSNILEAKEKILRLVKQETVNTVTNAIFAHPKLGALASNARAAFYLVDSISNLTIGCTRSSWEMQLDEWTPTLVTQVVNRYIGSSGLRDMNAIQRRRVAAFVLHALHQLKVGDARLPTFKGLDGSEIPAAESLLKYNLERTNDKLKITDLERFAFTVTPATAMILYSLAGVYATLVPGWKNEEEIAALYAVRQMIVYGMERYASDLSNGIGEESCLTQLDAYLGKIRLLRLRTKPQNHAHSIPVPLVDGGTIMINGDMASFADIIAPYTLIQPKHTQDQEKVDVKLYDEVNKCGLLKEQGDSRLLRGLIAIWQGSMDVEENDMLEFVSMKSKFKRNPQLSKAFPGVFWLL